MHARAKRRKCAPSALLPRLLDVLIDQNRVSVLVHNR